MKRFLLLCIFVTLNYAFAQNPGTITKFQEITNDDGTLYYHDISNLRYWLKDPEKQDPSKHPFLLPGSQIIAKTDGENIGSVSFTISRAAWCCTDQPYTTTIIDNEPPYIIDTFEVDHWIQEGKVNIYATPYSQDNAQGIEGETYSLFFATINRDYHQFDDTLNIRNLDRNDLVYEIIKGNDNTLDINILEGQRVYFEAQSNANHRPFAYKITGPNNYTNDLNYYVFNKPIPKPDGLILESGTYTVELDWWYSDGWQEPAINKTFTFTVSNPEETGKTYVPEDNFEQYLIDEGYDDVLDDYVLTENISTIEYLYLASQGIKYLTGLQDFGALKHLDVSYNPIYQIDVSQNTLLTSFIAQNTTQLYCIQVSENQSNAIPTGWSKDDSTQYSLDCNFESPEGQTYVPDNNFEQYLIDEGYDDVLDNYVFTENISTFEYFYLEGVSDLTGLQDFSALKHLGAPYADIEQIDVSQNKNLELLNLMGSRVKSIDVTNNALLKHLETPVSEMTTIDLSNNPDLEVLKLESFKGIELNISNNPKLVELSLKWVSKLKTIDLSNNLELEVLDLEHFKGTELNISNHPKLVELSLGYTNLTELNISNQPQLKSLEIISDDILTKLDLTANGALETLKIRNTSISELDLQNNVNLNSLDIYGTQLQTLDVSNNSNLTTLKTEYYPQLSCIQVSENQLNNIPADWSKDDSTQYSLNCSETFSGSITGFQEITNDNGTLYYHDLIHAEFNPLYWLLDTEKQDFTKYPFLLPDSKITVQTEGNNIESVQFTVTNAAWCCADQPTTRIIVDNEAPYTFDTFEDQYNGEGWVGIQAIAYSEDNAQGLAGNSQQLNFRTLNYYREFKDKLNIRNLADNSIVYEVIEGQNNNFNINITQGQTVYFEPQNKNDQTAGTPFSYTITGPNVTDESNYFVFGNVIPSPNGINLVEGTYTINLGWYYSDGWLVTGLDKEFTFTVTNSEQAGKTYIPDNNFEQALINLGYDDVLDDNVLTANISSVAELELFDKNIQDLTGLQDFEKLQSLFIRNNPISEIDISNNSALITLELIETGITRLEVSNHPALEKLFLPNNDSLRAITISYSPIEELNLSSNTALEYIDIHFTNISVINLMNSATLKYLYLAENPITKIDVSTNSSLIELDLSNTNITSLDVSNNPALKELFLADTSISSIDVTNNTLLNILQVSSTQLTSLNVANITELQYLQTKNTPQLTCIQVSESQLLAIPSTWSKDDAAQYSIDCNSNVPEDQTYILDNNFEQALINLGYDDVLDDYILTENIATITQLVISNSNIQDLTGLQDFTALRSLDASVNPLSQIDISKNQELEILLLGGANLTSLDVSNNTMLTELDMNGNALAELDVSNNIYLERIEIAETNVSTLNISSLSKLVTLNIFNSAVASLDLPNNAMLSSLNVGSSQLTTLDISNNSALNTLFAEINPQLSCIQVSENQLNNIPANWTKDDAAQYSIDCNSNIPDNLTFIPDNNFEQALINLGYDDVLDDYILTENIATITQLVISNNDIQDLTGLQDFTALRSLDSAVNPLSQIDISKNQELEILLLGGCNITSLDVSNNTKLTELDINGNAISALNVSNNVSLKRIEIADSKIESLDVSKNNALEILNIFNTAIANLDLENNLKLNTLNASSTQLSSLDVSNNDTLTILKVDDNKFLNCIQVSTNQLNDIPIQWIKDNLSQYSLDCSEEESEETEETEDDDLTGKMTLFPTLTDGIITIENNLEQEIEDVSIRSLNGILVEYQLFNDNPKEMQFDLGGMATGLYIIHIKKMTGDIERIKVLIK